MSSNTLNASGKSICFAEPKIMGILNLTPDSFFDGNRHVQVSKILQHIEKMQREGMDILDIGAFSSRPGAKFISQDEELERLMPPLRAIMNAFPKLIVSIDTFRAGVAQKTLDLGVAIINDITAFNQDPLLLTHVKSYNAAYVLMHMQGAPENMQDDPKYNDIILDIIKFLKHKMIYLHERGIYDIIIDPGFGFGKSLEDNYKLLKNLKMLALLDSPILAGLSRKSMLSKVINSPAEHALNATTAANVMALMNGAKTLRVHDIKEAKEAISIFLHYEKS